MAINFTDSPANGATQVIGGRTYTYNSTKNKWDTTATEVTGPTATVYANVDALPTSGNITGAQAYVSGNNRLYIWNGTGWYNIALINTAPTISGVNSFYTLATDGSSTSVVITATDPEGLPLTYSIASDTSGDIATVTQGVGGNTDIFTITPSTNEANAGTFSLTFRASDGVNVATAVAEFTLQFRVPNSNYTTALITTNGNTGQNTAFTDSSSNSHTVTVNGGTHQTSFSPYRSGGYSAYFDGSGDLIEGPSVDLMGSGAFTVECWVYLESSSANYTDGILGQYQTNQKFILGVRSGVARVWMGGTQVLIGTTNIIGEWHHIALTRNSSNSCQLYIDGVAEGAAFTNTTDFSTSLENFEIGSYDLGVNSNLNGYVRDLRVVKGTAVYTAAFTPPTEPLTAITNTSLLACHLPYIADGSTNAHALVAYQNTATKPFGPYDYQEYAVGDHGGSAYFDGSGDYLSVPDSDDWHIGASDFTIECWIYKKNDGSWHSLLSNRASGTNEWRMLLDYTTSYNEGAFRFDWGSAYYTWASAGIEANTWTHLALTRSGTTATLYVNGVAKGTNTLSDIGNISGPLILGSNDGSGEFYSGNVCDLKITKGAVNYTTDFTPPTSPLTSDANTSILLNMQGAVILDKSQTVTELKLSGATASTAQYKYLPSSIYFDGTNDYARADDALDGITSTTPFTIEAWVYPTQIGASGNRYYFFGINNLSAGGNILLIGPSNIGVNGSSDDTTDLSLNTWSHIAFVYDGNGGWKYYINGTLDYTQSDTITLDAPSSFLIGAEADAANAGSLGNYFGGYLSDIRITKGLQRYTANFTPPSAALDG